MKDVYGYIRVSTERQGVKGVSLEEQKDAIERYSKQNNLSIIHWFEERETAAKLGRPTFTNMISLLRSGIASGVVIHKIDRSARNLRDWADLVDLSDQGVEIHFVNESIDMAVRGGRLSADIQAVVAADYIRNLREETIKGMRGRLKQGLYPMRAPIGYLDKGGGNVKALDPIKARVIKRMFKKYATGEYTLKSLLRYARDIGFTNLKGGELSLSGISTILNNRFYTGVIHVRTTGESFSGKHEPIVSQELFNQVQRVLKNKTTKGKGKHNYTYSRMFTCASCARSLIGEKQKQRIYYRCHNCPGVSVREDSIEASIKETLKYFKLEEYETEEIENARQKILTQDEEFLDNERKALTMEQEALDSRLSKLTDALIDETIDKELFLKKKNQLIHKMQAIKGRFSENDRGISEIRRQKALELDFYKNAYLDFQNDWPEEKRRVLREMTSNRSVERKNVTIELHSPFQELCDIKKECFGDPYRGRSRTLGGKKSRRDTFRMKLDEWIKKSPAEGKQTSP